MRQTLLGLERSYPPPTLTSRRKMLCLCSYQGTRRLRDGQVEPSGWSVVAA